MTEIGAVGRFVDRGDPSDYDFSIEDLIIDTNNHDLDISHLVPKNAKAILFIVIITGDAAGLTFYLRKKEKTSYITGTWIATQVANVQSQFDGILSIGPSTMLTYTTYGTTLTGLKITIKGWWI